MVSYFKPRIEIQIKFPKMIIKFSNKSVVLPPSFQSVQNLFESTAEYVTCITWECKQVYIHETHMCVY